MGGSTRRVYRSGGVGGQNPDGLGGLTDKYEIVILLEPKKIRYMHTLHPTIYHNTMLHW